MHDEDSAEGNMSDKIFSPEPHVHSKWGEIIICDASAQQIQALDQFLGSYFPKTRLFLTLDRLLVRLLHPNSNDFYVVLNLILSLHIYICPQATASIPS
jgi:hypothetical protein